MSDVGPAGSPVGGSGSSAGGRERNEASGGSDSPELVIGRDLLRRAVPVAPVLLAVSGAVWGWAGVASAAFALALVLANFMASAWTLAAAARISLGLLMAAALFGFVARLGLMFGVVLVVRDAGWVEWWPLGLTLVTSHVGLLAWETRYVSATLAFPGLVPRGRRAATRPRTPVTRTPVTPAETSR